MFRIHQNMWIFFLTYINLKMSSYVLKDIYKVKFSRQPLWMLLHWSDSPSPPPPSAPCPHFPSKFNWSPFRILLIFLAIRPFGFSVTTDSHLYSPKNQEIPSKILFPPPPINNDRSLSIDSSFSRLKVQVLGKNCWKHWLRYFHTFVRGRRNRDVWGPKGGKSTLSLSTSSH